MERILITDKVSEILPDGLRSLGYQVDYDTSVDLVKLAEIIENYVGVVINSKIIMDAPMIDKGVNLKFIARLGSGMEIIDVAYAKSKGITSINTPEGNRNAVAEHAIGMLLCLSNNLTQADREVRQMIWKREKNRGFELKGKTIGIIGLGHTGGEFAKKMSCWGVKVIAHDKYRTDYEAELGFVDKMSLNDIFIKSDIITLHLPLTEETKYLINDDSISLCKNGVIIVNTSRGKVVQLSSLLKGLESGKIGGACLDVFENEKVETFSVEEAKMYQKLYDRQDVILSPHIAGWTHESLKLIAELTLDRIKNVLKK